MSEAVDDVAKESDEWGTPQDLFDAVNARWHVDHDCFATAANAKCSSFWTREDDAIELLSRPVVGIPGSGGWKWWNPPYSKPHLPLVTRLMRSVGECIKTVGLVPATPGAGWFQDNVLGGADLVNYLSIDRGPLAGKVLQLSAPLCRIEVNFLRGRLEFVNPDPSKGTAAKTDSAIVRFFPRGVNW